MRESKLVFSFTEPTDLNQIEIAKQKVRLNSNQRVIQPLANICWNPISAHVTILTRSLKSQPQLTPSFTWACWKQFIFHGKKQICAGKSSSYSLYNCFGMIKACCHWIEYVSPYYCTISLKCISPYCIWSLKDPAHHIPNQTEIASEEFFSKSLMWKQNEIDFIG